MLLESIYKYGNSTDDILVYTSSVFMELIKSNILYSDRIKFKINDSYDSVDSSCKARLDFFDLDGIDNYTKILYLDIDIIIKGPLSKVFNIIERDILYVLEEGNLNDCDDFYGGKTLFGREIHNYSDISAFTTGIMLFNNCENIKMLFHQVKEDIVKRPHFFNCYDQPYIVYNAFKSQLFDNKKLKQYAVNNDYIVGDKIIHHFPGIVGSYIKKTEKMIKFMDDIRKTSISFNQLAGKAYFWESNILTFYDDFTVVLTQDTRGTYKYIDEFNIIAYFGNRIHNIQFINNYTKFVSVRQDDQQIVTGVWCELVAKNKIIGITVSVNYTDYLTYILENNAKHLEKWYIVTSREDIKTINLIKGISNVEILYYNFYENGSLFDKGGALRYAQEIIANSFSEPQNILILDSDIYLPENFSNISKTVILDDCLFGVYDRFDYATPNDFLQKKNGQRYIHSDEYAGFFQLYKDNPKYRYKSSYDCSKCDFEFRDLFPRKLRLNLPLDHLGEAFINWGGRKTESFKSEFHFYVSITTVKKYKTALDLLLFSMPREWKSRYILVYMDEPEDTFNVFEDGHIEVTITNNIQDYGNWVGINMLFEKGVIPDDSWFLFVHDTCRFFDSVHPTNELLRKYDSTDIQIVWLCQTGQCNICLIRKQGILQGNLFYKDLQYISKQMSIDYEWNKHHLSPKRIPVKQLFLPTNPQHRGIRKIYGSNNRNILFYPDIRIEKYYFDASHNKHPFEP